jgi:internalin A
VAVTCQADEPEYFDLRRLSDLDRLEILSLVNVRLDDLSALPALPIEQLEIQGAGVADLRGIEHLGKLRIVGIFAPSAPKLEALGDSTVSDLTLPVDVETDLSAVARMRRLEQLSLSVKDGSELPKLVGLTQVRSLTINGPSVTRLNPVSELRSLENLDVSAPHVEDVAPLAGLTLLRSLILQSTQVGNLTPLSKLSQLEELRISGTRVTDLSPLHKLKQLRHLEVLNTPVTKESLARFRRALPHCEVAGK